MRNEGGGFAEIDNEVAAVLAFVISHTTFLAAQDDETGRCPKVAYDWGTLSHCHFERKREFFAICGQVVDVWKHQTGNLLSMKPSGIALFIRSVSLR